MQSQPNHRNYGLIIVASMLLSLFLVISDNQSASTSPGFFSAFHQDVWCHTVIHVADQAQKEGTLLILNHYPGKKLRRVMEDFGIPPQAVEVWLDAERETFCFRSWREAALGDYRFAELMKGHESIIARWSEATFKEAMLTLTFEPHGEETLQAALYRQAQQQRREATGQ